MKKRIAIFILCLCAAAARAQNTYLADTACVRIFFKQGYSTFDPSYRGNGAALDSFLDNYRRLLQDSMRRIRSIRISSNTSPEGSKAVNNRISRSRANNIETYLRNNYNFPASLIDVSSQAEDWAGLIRLVENSDMPDRGQVLRILDGISYEPFVGGIGSNETKRRLQTLNGGRTWQYMLNRFFPELRNTRICALCEMKIPEVPEPVRDTVVRRDTVIVRDTVVIVVEPDCKPFYMALKTNMLYDAALVPNIGAEFYVGRGWSLGADWMYAWWSSNKRHRYWRIYGGEIGVRKYFGRRAAVKPLTGHHLGLYLQGITYDFETGGTGYQSDFSYGAGIEYGYSLPVGRRLNIDFGIGIGYLGGEYRKYTPEDDCYVWQATKQRHWFGPTKAEISLVWLIGYGNYNKKGDMR